MYSTVAILAALNSRSETGQGQYIDMALLDCIVAFGGNQVLNYLIGGKVPRRYGNAHSSLLPYEAFATSDVPIIVAVGNDKQWQRFCMTIERPDLAADERYASTAGRVTRRDTLLPELVGSMLKRCAADWLERLEANGVACGPINNYQQVFENPQVQHRQLRVDMLRSDGGSVPTIASPLRLRGTPVRYDQAPPLLGEHTEALLQQLLGKSTEQIARLRASGVV
jgi:crotonobetainyl-CoA:carnitine CoA-transferase CaiB-like acyl-CoA transferase